MENFRPYGQEDLRVVSDVSRFDHEKNTTKVRSRNTTPPMRQTALQLAERTMHSNSYEDRDELFDYYAKPSLLDIVLPSRPGPYPPSLIGMVHEPRYPHGTPPAPPPKDATPDLREMYGSRHILQLFVNGHDLPPLQDSRDYAAHQMGLLPENSRVETYQPGHDNAAFAANHADLVNRVMNRPLIVFGQQDLPDPYQNRYTFTSSNTLDLVQAMFAVVVITLASILASQDPGIDIGIYRYFIATGVIVLVVALLFLTKTVNFARRHGVLYCVVALVLTGVALILSITTVATNNHCAQARLCLMRKALATFAILSFFVWVCTVVMYLTAMYISRLETSHQATPDRKRLMAAYESDRVTEATKVDDVPQYYLTGDGDMLPLDATHDIRGARKMVVYTNVG